MADSITHLRTELKMLGNQHKRWKEKVPILQERIRQAHAAGMKQAEIAELSGYERDNVRLLCMSAEQREELRARRRVGVGRVTTAVSDAVSTAADAPRVKRSRPKRT